MIARHRRLLVAFLPIMAIFALCAAASQTQGRIGSAPIKNWLDEQFIPALRSYDSSLVVSNAKCPKAFDFSNGTTDFCSITVNGVAIYIPISYDRHTQRVNIAPASFFEFDAVERFEQSLLKNQYGIDAVVHCGTPRYRFLQIGTMLTCAVTGSNRITSVRLRAEANGQMFMYNPAGIRSPEWMTTALAEHAAGKPTVVNGPAIAQFIQNLLNELSAAKVGPSLAITTRCPPSVDLSGAKHAICVVTVGGHDIRREVFIDPAKGLYSRAIDTLVDFATVQREVQNDLNSRLKKAGKATDGAVRCASGMLVVTPPYTFTCAAKAGTQTYKAFITVTDGSGAADWQFFPTGATPSASPSPLPTAP